MNALKYNSYQIRKKLLEITFNTGVGHIGSSMSSVEIFNCIYASVDREKIKNNDLNRDRIILSKGHGISCLYACLSFYGIMSDEEVLSICENGSVFGGHPPVGVSYIEHPTGALGHGASVAVGMAYALKYLQKSEARVFVVLGDGELHEGSNWEAFLQAVTLKLDNLYFIIDRNRLSGIDSSSCCELGNLEEKMQAFDMNVIRIDGHDENDLLQALKRSADREVPFTIICDTIKGKGVSFMENDNVWHYRPLNEETYKLAMEEVFFE